MKRMIAFLSILVVVPIGFYSKFYCGPGKDWVNNSLGGVFYDVFWCLALYFFFPRIKPRVNALIIFCATCLIEVLQLWHPPFLEMIRDNFIGRTILGNSFAWTDFPYYLIGSLIGCVWIRAIQNSNLRERYS